MDSTTRNLIIAVALPHLVYEEDRIAFLAEQAALSSLSVYGPDVMRRLARSMGNVLSAPGFMDGLRTAVENSGGPDEAKATILSVFDRLANIASAHGGRDAAGTYGSPIMGNMADLRLFPSMELATEVLPDGALSVTRLHDFIASTDGLSLDVDAISYKILTNASGPTGLLIGHDPLSPTVRVIANIPVSDGRTCGLDTTLPLRITPGTTHMFSAKTLVALPDDVLDRTYEIDGNESIGLSIVRNDKTGRLGVVLSAVYRPVSAASPVGAAPRAVRVEGAATEGSAAEDGAHWYNVVLVERGLPPYRDLVQAIASLEQDSEDAVVKKINDFDGPTVVARFESQQIAEAVRAKIIETTKFCVATVIPVEPLGDGAPPPAPPANTRRAQNAPPPAQAKGSPAKKKPRSRH